MDITQLGRCAEIAFLLFKLISCFTGSFLCIYIIGRILFTGLSFSIRIRPPQYIQEEDDSDEEDTGEK